MSPYATFRFLGDLQEFLAPRRRDRAIEQPLYDGAQSVKHLLEALGPPHTEVAWIVANGRSVAFDYIVPPAAEVIVYGWGTSPAVRSLIALRPPLPRPARFLLDNHLGRLARTMRLLGIDTLYYNNSLDDAQLAQLASEQQRVLLSRDRGLLKRSVVTYGYCLRTTDSEQQLRDVVTRFNLKPELHPWSRCLRCNGQLAPAAKEEILDRLEPRTRQHYDTYYRCRTCRQIYWKGSHFPILQQIVASIIVDPDPLQ